MNRNLNKSSAGRRILGTPKDGYPAALIAAQTAVGDHGPGLLYDDALLPANAGKRLRLRITSSPGIGTLFIDEFGAVELTGAPDGAYSIGYDVYANNQNILSDVATITVGSVNASAPGATLNGAGTITPGAGLGQQSGIAPGATLNGAGTIAPGQASGQKNATAPGATLNGTSTITPGAATPSGNIDANAPGALLNGAGTIVPGSTDVHNQGDAPGATLNGPGTIAPGQANGQQNATAPGAQLAGGATLDPGQALGDHDGQAPGAELTGQSVIIAGSANQQAQPRVDLLAVLARRAIIRSGPNPNQPTIAGETIRLTIELSNDRDDPVDASTLRIRIQPPKSPERNPLPTHDATGRYSFDLLLDKSGTWYWRIEVEAPLPGVAEGDIEVAPSRFLM